MQERQGSKAEFGVERWRKLADNRLGQAPFLAFRLVSATFRQLFVIKGM